MDVLKAEILNSEVNIMFKIETILKRKIRKLEPENRLVKKTIQQF